MMLESGSLVSVNRTAAEVTYHIHEKNLFYTNGFKVLQNNYKAGFVKCSKGTINGKIRLTYAVADYVTLAKILTQLNSYSFLAITCSLLHTALALREIGFLQRENISIDPADIFIDKESFKTYLIYLPLNVHTAPNAHMTFEKNLRTLLLRVAAENKKNVASDFAKEICADLANVQVGLQDIVTKIEMEGLQTTGTNTSKPADSRRFGNRTNTYEPKPPQPPAPPAEQQASVSPQIGAPAPQSVQISRVREPLSPEEAAKKAEKRQKLWKDIGFFAGYCVLLFVAIWVIAHYFSNSGLTINFIVTMVAVLILVLLAPVLYLTRRGKTAKKEMPDSKFLLDEPKPLDGMMPTLVLKNISGDVKIEFFIHKPEFVIGKADKQVDGLIPFDKTISDRHCRIVWKEKFYIEDLDSDYGTLVNGDRVMPGQLFPLYDGDKIQLSRHILAVREIR